MSALEIDVRQHSGQPVKPGETSDDDLKLLALQALMNNNSPEAVPMLEKILQGPQSPRVKDRALFVLAQTQTAPARAIVTPTVFGTGMVLGFGCLLFDSSPIFIAKDAPSANEISTNLFQEGSF